MSITVTTEKQFESDIEAFLISAEGGYTKGNGTYNPKLGVYPDKLIAFIRRTQPREIGRASCRERVSSLV